MSNPVRVTDSGDYLEVDLFFDRFADCKNAIREICDCYSKNYLTGVNFIVVNGQYFLVMFFDVSEVVQSQLEDFLAGVLSKYDYHIPKVVSDDYYMKLVKQSDFHWLGDADEVVKTIPASWNIYDG